MIYLLLLSSGVGLGNHVFKATLSESLASQGGVHDGLHSFTSKRNFHVSKIRTVRFTLKGIRKCIRIALTKERTCICPHMRIHGGQGKEEEPHHLLVEWP